MDDEIFDVLYRSAGGIPLITSLWEAQSPGLRFARKHGFMELRRTFTPELRLSLPDVLAIRSLETAVLVDDYEIIPLTTVADGPQRQQIMIFPVVSSQRERVFSAALQLGDLRVPSEFPGSPSR